MPFDLAGAKAEGYTDTQIAEHLAPKHNFDLAGARDEGYTDAQIAEHLGSIKPRGLVSAFGAGAGAEATGFVRALGEVAGLPGVSKWAEEKRAGFAPTAEEQASIPLSVARGIGGLAADLPVIAGTAALLPEVAGAGTVGLALRGITAMTPVAASAGVNTAADLVDKGVDARTATTAGITSAVTTAAMGAVPLSLTGGLLKRATSGAISGMALGEVSRQAQNAALSDHPELQTEFHGQEAVTSGVVSAMLAGIMGPRPIKSEITNMKAQAEADVKAGAPVETAAPSELKLEPTGETPPAEQPRPEFALEPQAAQREIPLEEPAPAAPEINPAQTEMFAPKPVPTRAELGDIATTVLGTEHSISKQAMAQAVKGADTIEAVADNLRAKADKTRDAGVKSDLQQLADHLNPRGEQNALQIEGTAGEVPRPAGGGENIPGGREGIRPEEQRAAPAPEGEGTQNAAPEITPQEPVNVQAATQEAPQAVAPEAAQPQTSAAPVAPQTWAERLRPMSQAEAERFKAEGEALRAKEAAPAPLGENLPEDRLLTERRAEARAVLEQENLHELYDNLPPSEQDKIAQLMQEASDLHDAGQIEEARARANRAKIELFAGQSEDVFASRAPEMAVNPSSEAAIHAAATELLGSTGAVDRTVVFVTDAEKQIPVRVLNDIAKQEAKTGKTVTVAFAHNGKMYVFPEQIEAGTERAVILHEVGAHLGMEKLIGKDNFSALANQIREWSAGHGRPEEVELALKVKESLDVVAPHAAHLDQETVAYFVQHAVEAGIDPTGLKGQTKNGIELWLRKIWQAMKNSLARLGLDPWSLKAQDVVDLAHAAAVAHVEGIPGPGKETVDFRSPGIMRAARAVDFQAGPRQAVQAVDTVLTKATSLWDSLKPAIQKTHLNWSQMTHIADMYEHLTPILPQWGKDAVAPVRDKVNNMLKSGAIAKELNHAAQGIYDQMQALAPKQKEALVELMGKYQLAKIFPNKKIEEHTGLKPEEKQLYREAKQLYSQPGVAEAYDAARLHNQRLHDTGMASMLKSMGQIYGVPENLWRAIDVKEGMSNSVTALLKHVGLDEHGKEVGVATDPDLQAQFKTAMGLHEAKKTESYFSLGRDGDYMVNFRIKDTPEAHAAVQAALSASGAKDSIVVNPGDTHVFSMFETMNQMLAVTKQLDLIKEHLEPKIGTDATGAPTTSPYTAGLAVEKLKALDSSAPSFIRGMLAKIDADVHLDAEQKTEQQELIRRMYINMLPESSASKFYARRVGTPGYSSDMARSFVKRAAAGAYFTAQHATRPEQNVAMARLRESITVLGDAGSPHFDLQKQTEAVNVINELNKRTANMLTPLHTPMIDTVSAIGHAFYLSASPGFILQNLAQPYQLTLPYLGGRHGFRASAVEMGVAAKDVAGIIKDTIQQGWQGVKDANGMVDRSLGEKWTGVLDATITIDRAEHLSPGDRDALKHLIASGRADWTQGGELTKIAEGANRSMETALKTANSMSYYGEVMNRMQTGLAAYRLEMKRSGNTNKAHDYMISAIDDTQINYATENRARAIGKHGIFGELTPMVMAFQQFNLGVLQLLGKLTLQATRTGAPAAERLEAVKSLGGIMAATGVAAGTMGLPFAGVVMGAYNALMGEENHPVDAKSDYQNFLSDSMGHDAAQVVSHGALNYITGADVASRLGQENVVPFTGLFSQLMDSRQPLKDRINAGALSFMGPVVTGGSNVLIGLRKIADGNTLKGLEQMSPAMTKGFIKASDLADNGFTDSKGNKLPMEATTWDTVVQAAGFTPAKLATQREAQQAVSAISTALKTRQHVLANQFVMAVEAGDVAGRLKVMDEARTFAQENPGMRVDFAGAMKRRAQEAAVARATGTGVIVPIRQLATTRGQTRFAEIQ